MKAIKHWKRLGSLLLSLVTVLILFSIVPVEVSAFNGELACLIPNDAWKKDNPRFAMYLTDDNGAFAWVDLHPSAVGDVYDGTIPEGDWSEVIFCRMNPNASSNGFEPDTQLWGKTASLRFPSSTETTCRLWDSFTDSSNEITWEHTHYWTLAPAEGSLTACFKTYYCQSCSERYCTEETTHNFEDGICKKCDLVCWHEEGKGTCAGAAVCSFCGYAYDPANSNRHISVDTATGLCTHCGVFAAVAKVGDRYYGTLQKAFDAVKSATAADNTAVTLVRNFTMTEDAEAASGVFKLDLAGFTIDTADYEMCISGATVELKSSTAGGKITSGKRFGFVRVYEGKLEIRKNVTIDVTYRARFGSDGLVAIERGTLILDGGAIHGSSCGVSVGTTAGKFILKDGVVTAKEKGLWDSFSTTIYHGAGTVHLLGGKVSNTAGYAVESRQDELVIKNTEISFGTGYGDVYMIDCQSAAPVMDFREATGDEYVLVLGYGVRRMPVEKLQYNAEHYDLVSTDTDITDGYFDFRTTVTLTCAHKKQATTPNGDLTHDVVCQRCGKHTVDDEACVFDRVTHQCACGRGEKFSVTWENGDGGAWEKEFAFGAEITLPTLPDFAQTFRKTHHNLTGWENEDGYKVGDTMPGEDIVFTAVYTPKQYPISVVAKDQTVTIGEDVAMGLEKVTVEGFDDPDYALTAITLTGDTSKVTARGEVIPSGAVIVEDGEDITKFFKITYVPGKLIVKPDTSGIDDLTVDNVTPEDLPAIEEVEEMMDKADREGASDELQDAWDAIDEKVQKLKDKIKELLDYKITSGNGATWKKGNDDGLTFVASGPFVKFQKLVIDGKEVAAENYTASSGSTVIEVKTAFLQSLKKGEHTIEVVYTDGVAAGNFFVKLASSGNSDVPGTGDVSQIGLWIGMITVSVVALAVILILLKKKKK